MDKDMEIFTKLSLFIKRSLNEIWKSIRPQEQISMPMIYQQISSKLQEMDEWYWLIDAYVDDSTKQIYCVVAKDGLLYKADVLVDPSGITIGAFIQVQEVFQPVANRFMVKRMEDGSSRWFMISSTAVINRNGAIDSTQLYDNLIRHTEEDKKLPYLAFCHQHNLKMGTVDWVARDGFVLLASGMYDNSELGDAMQRAYAADPNYWGASISFWPLEGHMEEIAKDVVVPVYTDGEFEEITIAPKEIACCILTALQSKERIINMDQRVKDAIKKLAGDDTELADRFIALADGVNDEIIQQDMVRRTATETPAPAAIESVTPPTEPIVEQVVEPVQEEHSVIIDEEVVSAVVEKADVTGKITAALAPLIEQFNDALKMMNDLHQEFNDFRAASQAASNKFNETVDQIKKTQEQDKKEVENDMPRRPVTRVQYRPRQTGTAVLTSDDGEKPALNDIAEDTLSRIK
jgi:hypothetical protein